MDKVASKINDKIKLGELTSVQMNLTRRDMENVKVLQSSFHSNLPVDAVCFAMEIVRELLKSQESGKTLLIKDQEGNTQRVDLKLN